MMDALLLTYEDLKSIGVVGGWAPGDYYATCECCGKKYLGDKRSTQCFVCAVKEINATANNKRVQSNAVRNAIERVNLAMGALERLDSVLGKMFVDPSLPADTIEVRHSSGHVDRFKFTEE